jgi:hypothetical protein
MWWIIAITASIILIQLFLLIDYYDKPVNPGKKAIIILLSFILWLFTFIMATTNSRFITDTINDYHKGAIIKVETITIQDVDTLKVIKYKYK